MVSFPSRVAIASAENIQVQGNDSDKILLSFAIHNTGANLKTVRRVTLTITTQEEEVEFIADAQFDQLKNIQLSEFQLIDNENYSLISAFSIPSQTHAVANYLFFYQCDRGWNSKEKLESLGCGEQAKIFNLEPGLEYRARIHVDAFNARSQDACFVFTLPGNLQSTVLDFSPIHHEISCR